MLSSRHRFMAASVVMAVLFIRTPSAMADDAEAPSAPTSLSAKGVTSRDVSLSWDASTDNVKVVGYNIYRNGRWVATATQCSYRSDGELEPHTEYSFAVAAYDAAKNVSMRSAEATARTLHPPPRDLKISYPSTTQAHVTWQPDPLDSGIEGYQIEVGGARYATTSTSYDFSGLTPGDGKLLHVRALHSGDEYGDWSMSFPRRPPTTFVRRILYVDQSLPVAVTDGTYDVGPADGFEAGNAYPTIRAALAAMNRGDTVLLRGGVYFGRVVLPNLINGDSWEEGHYNTLASYPGEWAVLDGQNDLRGDDGQGSSSWLAVLGYEGTISYWKFERLEIRNGRLAGSTATTGGARGFFADHGPFIFRYCYIHDNYHDYIGANPSGVSGHEWNNCIVEYCHFKDNGSLTANHHNASHIIMYSDYASATIARDGFRADDHHTMMNNFRYNLFEGASCGMYETKAAQYFTGRDIDGNGYQDTYKEYGDKIHHNIFRDLGYAAIDGNQDFQQVYNNIVDNCNAGIYAGAFEASVYKTAVYNNTLINCPNAGIYFKQWQNPIHIITIEPRYYGYVYSNILDSCTSADRSNKEEVALFSADHQDYYLQDDFLVDRCYFYRPLSLDDKTVYIKDTRYTVDEFKTFRPGAELWTNTFDGGKNLYKGTSGADRYKTRGGHVLSGSKTIANAGIGGPHPYLEGVTLPAYIGATDPNDDYWVDGVLGLANVEYLRKAPAGDPDWTPPARPLGLRVR